MRRNGAGDLGRDAWEFLPQRFVLVYSELVRKGLASPGSSAAGMGERRGGEQQGPLKSEEALMQRSRIDRVLRKLATEVETGKREERLKCAGCARYVQHEWKFCAWCGTGEAAIQTWKGLPLR